MPYKARPLKERFIEKIEIRGIDECWPFTGRPTAAGYGAFGVPGRKVFYAHRLSYEYAFGEIGPGLVVCHKCDNPICCNPNHLFVGTQSENLKDMWSKGRNTRGEQRYNSKLTDDLVRKIRLDGRSTRKIAADYGISQMRISRIKRNLGWKHVV